jgi:hypothetical protein
MWIHGIFGRVCLDLGLRQSTAFLPDSFGSDLRSFVDHERTQFLMYGNADFGQVRRLDLDRVAGFHYVRDPRDIVVSAYFSHRNTHATEAWTDLIPYREKLRAASKEEGLHLELEFEAGQFDEMRSWKDCPPDAAIRHYRIEELTADPYQRMLDILTELGLVDEGYYSPSKRAAFLVSKLATRVKSASGVSLPGVVKKLPVERALGILHECDFRQRAKGRKPGEEDRGSHFRKGVRGDWLNHFTVAHLLEFKRRYEDLLFQFGYEVEPDWERQYIPMIEEREAAAAEARG